jgi:hypothetical protein
MISFCLRNPARNVFPLFDSDAALEFPALLRSANHAVINYGVSRERISDQASPDWFVPIIFASWRRSCVHAAVLLRQPLLNVYLLMF